MNTVWPIITTRLFLRQKQYKLKYSVVTVAVSHNPVGEQQMSNVPMGSQRVSRQPLVPRFCLTTIPVIP